jgi:hypothetical protein
VPNIAQRILFFKSQGVMLREWEGVSQNSLHKELGGISQINA